MATQTGRGGGGRDVRDGRAEAGRSGSRDNAMGGGRDRPGQIGRGGSAMATRSMHNVTQDTAFGSAPKGGAFGGQSAMLNPRRTQNVTPSYERSLHNMYELSKMMPGPGLVGRGAAAIAGYGPDFTGYTGQRFGPGDYDPRNRDPFAEGGAQRPGVGIQQPRPIAAPGMPQSPMLGQTVPAASLGGPIPGLQNYGLNLPSYGYFGQPGQQRPRSAMLGGF